MTLAEADRLWWKNLLAASARERRHQEIFRRLRKFLGFGLIAIVAAIGLHLGFFCYRFDVFSDPVFGRDRGWLGPYIRGNRDTVDVGKVGYYESTDYALYDFYSGPCRAWIFLNGLNYRGT